MGEQKGPAWYNEVFKTDKMYKGDYNSICYYSMWKEIVREIQDDCFFQGIREEEYRIYELGCGPGQFAHLLEDSGFTNYCGYDFSEEALKKARKLSEQVFELTDLLTIDCGNITRDADCICMLEFLEHIEDDIKVLKQIKQGKKLVITLPSFDGTSHVRFFEDSVPILARYGSYLDIDKCYGHGNHTVLLCKRNGKQ